MKQIKIQVMNYQDVSFIKTSEVISLPLSSRLSDLLGGLNRNKNIALVNGKYTSKDYELVDGDEVTILTPLAGG